MLMVEAIRNDINLNFNRNGLNLYCTMRNGIELCNIEKKNDEGEIYKKFPTLLELHYKLFNVIPNNLHNSLIDILICLRCFYKMIYNDDICKKNKSFNSLITNMTGV